MIEENKSMGYVKLFRSIKQWEWHDEPATLSLFIHCLAMANHKPTKWRGITIERGTFVSSRAKLMDMTGLSERAFRTALDRLKESGTVSSKSTNKYTIYKVENYDSYQGDIQQSDQQETQQEAQQASQQTSSKRHTNKKLKNEKKEEVKEKKKKEKFEPQRMIEEYTQDPSLREALLDFLDFRKSAKAAVSTKGQMQLLLNKLDQLSHGDHQKKIKIVNQSIERGWKGFFELREEKYGRTSTGYSNGDTTGAWDRVITWDDFNGNIPG